MTVKTVLVHETSSNAMPSNVIVRLILLSRVCYRDVTLEGYLLEIIRDVVFVGDFLDEGEMAEK